jgi:hypothetical protein
MKTTTPNIIVHFHVGRGGQFNNAGHKSFVGENDISDVISFRNDHIFIQDRDDKGRFISPMYVDHNGNELISVKMAETGVGILDFDGYYDSEICKYLSDCDENELLLIKKSINYKSVILEDFINTLDL